MARVLRFYAKPYKQVHAVGESNQTQQDRNYYVITRIALTVEMAKNSHRPTDAKRRCDHHNGNCTHTAKQNDASLGCRPLALPDSIKLRFRADYQRSIKSSDRRKSSFV